MYHPFFIDDEATWSLTWSKTKGDISVGIQVRATKIAPRM